MAPDDVSRLDQRLGDFLERLGRSVERPRPGQLIARHRTALLEEETRFKLVDSGKDRPLKTAINIFARHIPLPSDVDGLRCYYLDDFLDHTVQAGRIAGALCEDPEIRTQRDDFIAQNIASEGERLDEDAIAYFFDRWLPSEDERLLAVLAPAGYGKTVLTGEIAFQMAERYAAAGPGRRPPFPYLIPFGRFRRLASFEGMILTSLQAKGVTDYTSGAFAYLVQQNRVLLVLDGFDELLEERPEEARRNLRELIETLEGRGKVVVTARSTFFRTSEDVADFLEYFLGADQVKVIELQPFDRSQRRSYVEKHIRTRHAEHADQEDLARVLEFIDAEALEEVMGSPLLLKETVEALISTDGDARLEAEPSREALFDALERSVYERERRRHNHHFGDEVQRAFLEGLAQEMLASNTRGFDWDLIKVSALEALPAGSEPPETELDRLADHHFLTVTAQSGAVQFNHQVFREYFQARAVINGCSTGELDWVLTMLMQRPVPEEVRIFLRELDAGKRLPRNLIDGPAIGSRTSDRLVNNLGALLAAYGDRDLIAEFLAVVPPAVPLGFQITNLDLQQSDWSTRYLQGMSFLDCDLSGADFRGAQISELSVEHCRLKGARFEGAKIDSIAIDHGERIFGRPDVLQALESLAATTDLRSNETARDLRLERRQEIIETVKGRIRRFYIQGRSDAADSRWDSTIQERNLYGGVKPGDAKFVKSKVVPRMVSLGVLSRFREHGEVMYHLSNDAEDDARRLMESGEVTGTIGALIDRLAGRERSAAP